MTDKTKQRLFLEWFNEQYDCGAVDRTTCLVSEAYLQGLCDSLPKGISKANFTMAISTLRSARAMVEVLERYEVKIDDR